MSIRLMILTTCVMLAGLFLYGVPVSGKSE